MTRDERNRAVTVLTADDALASISRSVAESLRKQFAEARARAARWEPSPVPPRRLRRRTPRGVPAQRRPHR